MNNNKQLYDLNGITVRKVGDNGNTWIMETDEGEQYDAYPMVLVPYGKCVTLEKYQSSWISKNGDNFHL